MRKRPVSPFSLAFLDIMFCGFGAVVLLVMILNGEVLRKREARSEDLRGELARATALEEFARSHLVEIKSKIEEAELEEGDLESRVRYLQYKLGVTRVSLTTAKEKARKLKAASEKLRQEKAALERSTRLLKSKKIERTKSSNRLVGFTGDGSRQYLTGLKLGGERTLILLDTSASMLDETIVNIVRRKLMTADLRRRAPKWQRAVRTVHWLISNLRTGTKFQVYSFSTAADSVVAGSAGRWLDAGNAADLEAALESTRALAPANGTSLHNAFHSVSSFSPAPDSVILLTDGLPTQGFSASRSRMISGDERQALFDSAVTVLPKAVPVNTLLFPIEGDPTAAVAFWGLAVKSGGSFITPSRDWP
jgi:hypothetical protein